MEQALCCEIHAADRLIKVEDDKGMPLLRCPNIRCEFKRDIPIDQRYRAAGLPGLFDGLLA